MFWDNVLSSCKVVWICMRLCKWGVRTTLCNIIQPHTTLHNLKDDSNSLTELHTILPQPCTTLPITHTTYTTLHYLTHHYPSLPQPGTTFHNLAQPYIRLPHHSHNLLLTPPTLHNLTLHFQNHIKPPTTLINLSHSFYILSEPHITFHNTPTTSHNLAQPDTTLI